MFVGNTGRLDDEALNARCQELSVLDFEHAFPEVTTPYFPGMDGQGAVMSVTEGGGVRHVKNSEGLP
jgi:hypothetical protein